MSIRLTRLSLALCAMMAVVGCGERSGGDPADPKSYAVTLSVVPSAGPRLQRISLPARVLASLRTPDHADVRLFDGRGKVLPIASIAPLDATRPELRGTRLEAFPILGAAGALRIDGVTLNIDDLQRARVVRVDGAIDETPHRATVLGVLLDLRSVTGAASAITLDADVPSSQPVTFTLEQSDDLKTWLPLAEKVIYRREAQAGTFGSESVLLDDADLHGHYVRISWGASSRLLSPVTVRGAVVTTSGAAKPVGQMFIPTSAPRLVTEHDARFSFPASVALSAVRLLPGDDNALIPVRLFGRDSRDQAWAEIGAGTIAPVSGRDAGRGIALTAQAFRDYRIVADSRTAGFSRPPVLEVGFSPADIVAMFSGPGPFTLAAGLAGAPDTYLPLQDLISGQGGAGAGLPSAVPASPTKPEPLMLAPPEDDRTSMRDMVLWGMLILGTALLGAMVCVLWRRSSPPA